MTPTQWACLALLLPILVVATAIYANIRATSSARRTRTPAPKQGDWRLVQCDRTIAGVAEFHYEVERWEEDPGVWMAYPNKFDTKEQAWASGAKVHIPFTRTVVS
jgi:hypothetical protein